MSSSRTFEKKSLSSKFSFYSKQSQADNATTECADPPKKTQLSFYELAVVLRPFFWPAQGTDGAVVNRARAILTWVMVSASKACSLVSPVFLQTAVNALVSGDWQAAAIGIILYNVLRLAQSVFKEFQSILYIRVNQQASIELQEYTFGHLHQLSFNWHVQKKTGNIVRVMDRGKEAANILITYLFLFLIPALAECVAVVILFFVQYNQFGIALLVLGGVILYAVFTVRVTLWRKKYREKSNDQDNDFHYKSTDSILNYETVKYFTNEDFEKKRFRESVVKFQGYNSKTQFSLSLLNIGQQFFLIGTILGTALISGQSVVNGTMTIGGWVALQSWVVQIFVPLGFLGSVYAMIIQALVDVKNLSELLIESPDIVDPPNAQPIFPSTVAKATPADIESPSEAPGGGVSVEFRNLYFHYPTQDEDKGLRNVSFTVKAGTTTAVVGSTGAGKTTISRMLFRFYDPQLGEVLLDGKDIKQFSQKSVRQAIGIVPQDTVLFNDTLLHNIRYGRLDATMEEVEAAARAAQILTFIEAMPDKWETTVGERGLKLSGGEKQRVAIARCLLKNPPVVLLDEATSALDTVTESSVQEALRTLGQNRTVLVIAHRLSTIKHADQIVVLNHGEVAEVGTHEELLAIERGIYANLWNTQLRSDHAVAVNETEPAETTDGLPVRGVSFKL